MAAAVGGRPEKTLSVCFVAPHAWPALSRDPRIAEVGGAEVQQSILARLLAAQGYRVSMIAMDYGQPERVVIDGVTVHRIFRRDAGLPVLRFAHPRLTSMWRALREACADLYYCRSASLWVGVVAEYCRRYGARAVYAGASDRDFEPGQGGQIRLARDRWLFRRGIAAADAIVVQNERQRRQCRETFGREAVLIPSCYPVAERASPADRQDILWVGTLHANKRPGMFLDLAERLPGRRFVLVGGPSIEGRATYDAARARAAGLPNVEFTGFLPLAQVEARFDSARLLVNTSLFEGMPNTFLQAWARGVPTVATVDVGTAVNRVVADLRALESEVESLFDQEKWARASQACRAHFECTHSCAHALGEYARLFERLVHA
ncbi:MAG TPA: glycosyltransferase family 4 protein [Burkholderiales bacterium]|nr:glycosyltransferase family 4 protein [Burkholderiales bacterium]